MLNAWHLASSHSGGLSAFPTSRIACVFAAAHHAQDARDATWSLCVYCVEPSASPASVSSEDASRARSSEDAPRPTASQASPSHPQVRCRWCSGPFSRPRCHRAGSLGSACGETWGARVELEECSQPSTA
eukprot:2935503-Prymnesium_polylepis.1